MAIFLTGGTGFIGSAVLAALVKDGREITALVRSEDSATKVKSAGATALIGDITDVAWLTKQIATSDGVIHLASPGDATSRDVDLAVATAATAALTGSNKPYVHTSGIWIYGNNDAITEESPLAPPALVAWRAEVEAVALGGEGVRSTIIAPGVVYGEGKSLPNLITRAPHTDSGALTLIGDGTQTWTTIHVDDLAKLYVTVFDKGEAGNYYIGASGTNPTVLELAETASRVAGITAPPAVESKGATEARLSPALAEALLLSQKASGAKARSLGWSPTGPSLVEELATSYVVN